MSYLACRVGVADASLEGVCQILHVAQLSHLQQQQQ
jgi:hypothetical protein